MLIYLNHKKTTDIIFKLLFGKNCVNQDLLFTLCARVILIKSDNVKCTTVKYKTTKMQYNLAVTFFYLW